MEVFARDSYYSEPQVTMSHICKYIAGACRPSLPRCFNQHSSTKWARLCVTVMETNVSCYPAVDIIIAAQAVRSHCSFTSCCFEEIWSVFMCEANTNEIVCAAWACVPDKSCVSQCVIVFVDLFEWVGVFVRYLILPLWSHVCVWDRNALVWVISTAQFNFIHDIRTVTAQGNVIPTDSGY